MDWICDVILGDLYCGTLFASLAMEWAWFRLHFVLDRRSRFGFKTCRTYMMELYFNVLWNMFPHRNELSFVWWALDDNGFDHGLFQSVSACSHCSWNEHAHPFIVEEGNKNYHSQLPIFILSYVIDVSFTLVGTRNLILFITKLHLLVTKLKNMQH